MGSAGKAIHSTALWEAIGGPKMTQNEPNEPKDEREQVGHVQGPFRVHGQYLS